ncbi:MAG TPA: hypothetical protein VK204_15945 [Nocardioidaceae bacterium]|nr:hypothetical protein [Nocardioidaceae bacterium]
MGQFNVRSSLLSRVGRRLVVPATLGAVALQPLALASPAAAADISRCTGQDRVVERSVKIVSKRFTMTHGDQLDLPPGMAYKRKVTVERTTVLSANASGTVETSGGADWKIAKLDAKVTYSLAVAGSHTKKTSVTEEFNVPERKRTRLFLFYRGNTLVKGRWYQLTCSRVPGKGTEYWGSVKSYKPITRHGAIVCNHRLYDKGSVRYLVSRQAGC